MGKTVKRLRAIALLEHHGATFHHDAANKHLYKQVAALGYYWNTRKRRWEKPLRPTPNEPPQPCPFCGGHAEPQIIGHHLLVCTQCSATGPAGPSPIQALALWNRRIP